jgi:predicted transcriptional regulator
MPASNLRLHVHQIADALPPEATWDDVRYQVELRASIERGLADVEAGRVIAVEDLIREFGVAE